jgi:hypothetical protein
MLLQLLVIKVEIKISQGIILWIIWGKNFEDTMPKYKWKTKKKKYSNKRSQSPRRWLNRELQPDTILMDRNSWEDLLGLSSEIQEERERRQRDMTAAAAISLGEIALSTVGDTYPRSPRLILNRSEE